MKKLILTLLALAVPIRAADLTLSADIDTFLGSANNAAARTNLGLAIGTNVQAFDSDLTTYAGITPSANVQSLLGAADYSAMRTLLGLVIGTNVQAFDADLSALAALAGTDTIYYRSGANTWTAVTVGSGLSFSGGTLTASAGATSITDIGDASGDGSIAVGAHEIDFTSTIDASGEAIFTFTNTDADAANDNSFIDLRHNDGADANVFYMRFIGDNDGTPSNDYLFSQTAFTIGSGVTTTFAGTVNLNGTTNASNLAATSASFGTVTGAFDAGGATSVEIPNGNDPDVDAEGEISWDANGDTLRVYDGANQVAVARKIEAIHCTVVLPNDLADSERDAFWIWSNESGMSFVVTGWKAWSDTDDTTLNIEEIDADGANNATVDAVEIATNGTGLFYASDTTITAATIENGHILVLDFDDTDTPGQVKITIYGYYNADVN